MKPYCEQLYGDVLKSYVATQFALTETRYAPNQVLPEHSHEHAYFCLVLQGVYTENYGKQTRLCEPSTIILHPPNEIHSNHFQKAGGRCFNVQLDTFWLRRVREHSVIPDSPTHFRGGSPANLARRIYKEFCSPDKVSPLAIEGLTLELLAETSRRSVEVSNHKRPYWLEQAREILHAHFTGHLTLTSIAEMVGVHPVHVAREFRKHYRCTIGDYVRQLRVEFACRYLAETTTPLIEIALAAGFSHQSHFSRTFKRLTGMTPAQYRAISRLR